MPTIKIMLVDSQQLIMEGIKQVLENSSDFRVVATAQDGVTALKHLRNQVPDIVLMEIHMPGLAGLETCKIIARNYPQVRVVILTSCHDRVYVYDAVRAGAKGYLSKTITPQELVTALRTVYNEGAILPPFAACHILHAVTANGSLDSNPMQFLTSKEREILPLVVEGRTTSEIASFLFISPKTVRNHLSHIYEKLGTKDRLQTVLYMERMSSNTSLRQTERVEEHSKNAVEEPKDYT
jgi:two-component system, NarL family, response regulator DevR